MASMKISVIARSLNMKSSDLVQLLNENGFEDVRGPQSSIEDAAIAWIMQNVRPVENPQEAEAKKAGSSKAAATKTASDKKRTVKKTEPVGEKETAKASSKKEVKKAAASEAVKTEEAEIVTGKEEPIVKEKVESQTLAADKKILESNSESISETKAEKVIEKSKTSDAKPEKAASQNRSANNNQGNVSDRIERSNSQGRGDRNGQNRFNNDRGDRNGQNRYNNDRGDRNGQNRFNNDRGDRNNGQNRNNDRGDRNGQNRYNNDRSQNGSRGGFGGGRNDKKSSSAGGFDFGTPMTKNSGNNRGNGYNNNKSKNKEKDWDAKEKSVKKDPNRKGAFIKPAPVVEVEDDGIRNIILPEVMTIKELADKIKVAPAQLVKKLFLQGKMVSINQEISYEEAEEIALEFNCIAEMEEKVNVIEELLKEDEEDESLMKKRPPVVCVMGHVDHGKTSLLDAIRSTKVTEREAGGITQHIGAYVVGTDEGSITFLDTPGHEAFTSMRMRGAKSTDIAILVVAADDGVMPQTVEAISHAKAAGVEIIVAVNKIDKESANVERVKQELTEHDLIAEDWGGSTIFVPVSAHTKEGIDQLLEMITLTADVMELKANPNRKARGIVIEAQLDKGRGPVATILVQKGTLKVGDSIAIGSAYGKVRAMMDDTGRRVKEAKPSTPVEILGLNEVPNAGEIFIATDSDKEARNIAEAYIKEDRERLIGETKAKLSLDGLFSQIQAGNIKELNIIVKADVQGSVEAVKQSLLKLSNEEVAVRIIHAGVGAINESDVNLASASNAIIIGFNVRPDNLAKENAEREKVDLRLYKVIYNAIEDVEAAMKGMLDPVFEEKVIGHAEVRQVFKASGVGTIAGSYVLDGKVVRNAKARITREGELLFEGELASLKRFKDDVKEVKEGYECGLVFEKFNDIKELDQVEFYVMEEVPR